MKGKALGKFGEDQAEQFLIVHEFTILERNFRIRRGEIDIIARKCETIHFIEIKTWKCFGMESLEYAVDRKKRNTILFVSKEFLYRNRGLAGCAVQYDVLFIGGNGEQPELMENVFTESGVA